jgi:hypothetical protein
MCSLLPPPLGTGTRKNMQLREYVFEQLAEVEYRTLPCATKEEAEQVQNRLLATRHYRFHG